MANKGVLQLLKAFNFCSKADPNIKLMLVGGETYSSNAKTTYVKECLSQVNENKDNILLTGYIHNDVLPEYLVSADIGCVPSVYEEACGLTALEMMASGLPIITTDAAGLKEYVPDGCKEVSEWYVGMEKDDVISGLEAAINELSSNEIKRKEYGKLAALTARKYDIENYLNFFSSFIDI